MDEGTLVGVPVIGASTAWVLVGLAVVLTAVGHGYLKLWTHTHRVAILCWSLCCLGVVPVLNYLSLKVLALHLVYVSTALVHAASLVVGKVLLKEEITRRQVVAVAFIIVGIAMFVS